MCFYVDCWSRLQLKEVRGHSGWAALSLGNGTEKVDARAQLSSHANSQNKANVHLSSGINVPLQARNRFNRRRRRLQIIALGRNLENSS